MGTLGGFLNFRGEITTLLQHLLRKTLEKALTLVLVQGQLPPASNEKYQQHFIGPVTSMPPQRVKFISSFFLLLRSNFRMTHFMFFRCQSYAIPQALTYNTQDKI
jgi:hypothetical protein